MCFLHCQTVNMLTCKVIRVCTELDDLESTRHSRNGTKVHAVEGGIEGIEVMLIFFAQVHGNSNIPPSTLTSSMASAGPMTSRPSITSSPSSQPSIAGNGASGSQGVDLSQAAAMANVSKVG